jgi:predicted secreted protein
MSWFNNAIAFTIIYMVVFFCVLPIGVQTAEEAGQQVEPGHATSAPVNPRLGFKFLLTFGISLVLFGIYYVVGYYDLLGLGALFGRGT